MKTACTAGANPAALDFRKTQLPCFGTHEQANQLFLTCADARASNLPPRYGPRKATPAQVLAAPKASATANETLLARWLEDPAGGVRSFQPDVVDFVGCLIARGARQRGQARMLAGQAGHLIPHRIGLGLWAWGTLRRESVAGK